MEISEWDAVIFSRRVRRLLTDLGSIEEFILNITTLRHGFMQLMTGVPVMFHNHLVLLMRR